MEEVLTQYENVFRHSRKLKFQINKNCIIHQNREFLFV